MKKKDTISCIVVDDEPLARKGLEKYIRQIDFLSLEGLCKNAMEANHALASQPIDALFLDIEMPGISGINFLKTIQHSPWVVFTTAYPQYALEGYQFKALDYLVKPISFEHFLRAANKLHQTLIRPGVELSPAMPNAIFVKVDKSLVKVNVADILYIKSLQNYVIFYTEKEKYMTLSSLRDVYELLPADQFLQTHKSFIVSKEKIEVIHPHEVIIQNNRIPISTRLRAKVLEELTQNRLLKK